MLTLLQIDPLATGRAAIRGHIIGPDAMSLVRSVPPEDAWRALASYLYANEYFISNSQPGDTRKLDIVHPNGDEYWLLS